MDSAPWNKQVWQVTIECGVFSSSTFVFNQRICVSLEWRFCSSLLSKLKY